MKQRKMAGTQAHRLKTTLLFEFAHQGVDLWVVSWYSLCIYSPGFGKICGLY